MAKLKRKPNLVLLVGLAAGLSAAPAYEYVEYAVRMWVGNIVMDAVHQHWQFEQKALLFKPADSNQM